MKILYCTSDDDSNSFISVFLNNIKNFVFIKMEDVKKYKERKIIIIKKNTKQDLINKIFNKFQNNNLVFLINIENSKIDIPKDITVFFYPLNFFTFYKKFISFDEDGFFYKNILLKKDNLLINHNENKSVYLTETESKIMKMLIKNIIVERDAIKRDVLNLNSDIDTKSLESHLSRIRKKMKEINSNPEILSINTKKIKIF